MTAAQFPEIPTWSLADLMASIPGVRWLREPACLASNGACLGASIDSRTTKPGQVFFALRGEQTDGHRFVSHALAKGAACAVIDDEQAVGDLTLNGGVLLVPDVERAMGESARAYRRSVLRDAKVVAVTGSNGKTTTCRLLASALASDGAPTWLPTGSFNNQWGVPLTLLNAPPASRFVVCEVGTNAPGEIAALGAIIEPDACAILSVGRSHLEGLGSVEGVAVEKASLASSVREGGLVVANAEVPGLIGLIERAAPGRRVLSYGLSERAGRSVEIIELGESFVRCRVDGVGELRIGMPGRHVALNATAAAIVATELGVHAEAVTKGLAETKPASMRLQWERIGEVRLLIDAYNANPDSTLAAVAVLASAGGMRRVAVLGDMLELGESGPALHSEVLGAVMLESSIERVVCVGPQYARVAQGLLHRIEVFDDPSTDGVGGWAQAVALSLQPGESVLVKGSRGMRLERLIEAVRALHDPEQPDPEQPDPEQPDPEQPDPEQPDPEQPDPQQLDPRKPTAQREGNG